MGPVLKGRGKEPDERLLIEAAQRDTSCFGEVYELHFDRVYAYVVRRVGDRPTAEDLTAEVFQQALANIGRFEFRGAPFASWLFRIAANAIADHARRAAREHAGPVPEETHEPDFEEIEHRARLFRLVKELPEDQARVIALRFAEQKSIAEIARTLGRSEGAVKQLQFRGLQSLRARMGRAHG